MSDSVCEVIGLCARLGERSVLQDISFTLHPGQWTAVVGANGAGKTTLLKTLAGLLPPSAGQVLLKGRPIKDWPLSQRAQNIAWLAQGPHVSDNLTVAECVALGRLPHTGWWGQEAPTDRQVLAQALEMTGAQGWAHRRMQSLSGGERQRVLLARALAVQARLLLLDEPTTFLDPPHQQEVARLLRHLGSQQGTTVVSVIHDLSLALTADRLLVLGQGGQFIHHGTPLEAVRGGWLTQAFGHRIEVVEHGGQLLWRPDVAVARGLC